MPTLDQHVSLTHPKGTRVGQGVVGGLHPTEAILAAVDSFVQEFGYEPEQDERCFILVMFTTNETHCELLQWPESDEEKNS